MTNVILMQQTMSLLSQQSADELVAKGTIKLKEDNTPYLVIDSEKYLEVNINTMSNEVQK